MTAAIYLRVSTDRCRCGHSPSAHEDGQRWCKRCRCVAYEADQDEANQEPECRKICEARQLGEPLVFRERMSGAKVRPQWRALVEQVRRGNVRTVVVWAVDRVGRDKVQSAHDLRELARFGAQLVSVQDAWLDQPPGPMRDLLIDLLTWVAAGERARLIERTRAGLARARAQGKRLGRPVVPLDDARALALLRAGMSYEKAGAELGVSRSALRAKFPGWQKRDTRKRGGFAAARLDLRSDARGDS